MLLCLLQRPKVLCFTSAEEKACDVRCLFHTCVALRKTRFCCMCWEHTHIVDRMCVKQGTRCVASQCTVEFTLGCAVVCLWWQEDLTDHPPDFFVAVPLVFDVLYKYVTSFLMHSSVYPGVYCAIRPLVTLLRLISLCCTLSCTFCCAVCCSIHCTPLSLFCCSLIVSFFVPLLWSHVRCVQWGAEEAGSSKRGPRSHRQIPHRCQPGVHGESAHVERDSHSQGNLVICFFFPVFFCFLCYVMALPAPKSRPMGAGTGGLQRQGVLEVAVVGTHPGVVMVLTCHWIVV